MDELADAIFEKTLKQEPCNLVIGTRIIYSGSHGTRHIDKQLDNSFSSSDY